MRFQIINFVPGHISDQFFFNFTDNLFLFASEVHCDDVLNVPRLFLVEFLFAFAFSPKIKCSFFRQTAPRRAMLPCLTDHMTSLTIVTSDQKSNWTTFEATKTSYLVKRKVKSQWEYSSVIILWLCVRIFIFFSQISTEN